MSTNDHVPGTMHRDQHGNVIEDYHMCGCQPTERSAGAAPLDALVDAITEATPMIRDWLADKGPNTLDVARFIADRLGTDR